jgi:hypothetical protein
MPNAQQLLEWVSDSPDFAKGFPIGDDADVALDLRDAESNEDPWLREQEAVQQLLEEQPVGAEAMATIERIAEVAFVRTFEVADQHHDLAAQVSDDMQLLAEAAAVGYSSSVLTRLWDAYVKGTFPTTIG